MTKRPLSQLQLTVLKRMLHHADDTLGESGEPTTLRSLAKRGLTITHDGVYYRLTPEGRALVEHT